jgi:hypothetical protein
MYCVYKVNIIGLSFRKSRSSVDKRGTVVNRYDQLQNGKQINKNKHKLHNAQECASGVHH